MVNKRNVGLAIVLTLITCGIYGIFWFISLTNDVAKLSEDSSFSGGLAFLFTILTCGIYGIYWSYRIGKLIAEAQAKKGVSVNDNSILYLVLHLLGLGIVVYILAQSDVNSMA
jgi:hypothetical protein